MEEEDLILLAQEQSRLNLQAQTIALQPIVDSIKSLTQQQAKLQERANNYTRFDIDLSIAHTDLPLGIKDMQIVPIWLTIEKADSDFTYKLNQKSNHSFIGRVGASVSQQDFTEIFITNSAGTGTAIILVGWKD